MRCLHALLLILLAIGPTALADKPMNVILIVSDDLNVDLACYGHEVVKTPNIDRLRSRSVVFDRAYAQYPLCNPSRNSFLTGRYPQSIGCVKNTVHLRENAPDAITLPQYFKQHGYTSISCGKIFHLEDPRSWSQISDLRTGGVKEPGRAPKFYALPFNDENKTIGEGRLIVDDTVPWFQWRSVTENEELLIDQRIANAAINRLDEATRTDKPFFLAVGFSRPHDPYFAPKRFFDLYPLKDLELPKTPVDASPVPANAYNEMFMAAFQKMNEQDKREAMRAYYAGISYMDEQLGRVLDHAEKLGALENTVIVFMSDHGYLVGEKNYWNKGLLFDRSCLTPMMVAVPNMDTKGKTSSSVVELIDLFPTLVELCDLPNLDDLEGQSLVPLLREPDQLLKNSFAYTVCNNRPALQGSNLRLIRWAKNHYAMFDHSTDPNEHYNIAEQESANAKLQILIKRLEEIEVRLDARR